MTGLRPLELARLSPASRRRIYEIERRQKEAGNDASRKGHGTRERGAKDTKPPSWHSVKRMARASTSHSTGWDAC